MPENLSGDFLDSHCTLMVVPWWQHHKHGRYWYYYY